MSSGTWKNNDGLFVEFGTSQTVSETAGEHATLGKLREVEVQIDLTKLTTTPTIISNNFKFPAGMRIQQIIVNTHTAAVGASATLDIGLQKEDRLTEIDYNGLVAALPLASLDVAGETTSITAGTTGAGVLVGGTTSEPGYLTANANAAVFTQGSVHVRIYYYGYGTITQ